MADELMQPIIRGIQTVGAVQVLYRYNKKVSADSTDYMLPLVEDVITIADVSDLDIAQQYINCGTNGIPVAGFRLDSEFLRANPQIASSFVIPILGGGGVALTNNNRTGVLQTVCTKVTVPDISASNPLDLGRMIGKASGSEAIGVLDSGNYYDMVTLAQIQQAQRGGDSYGAQIGLKFTFCGITVRILFEGITIASVDPIGLKGNDATDYALAMPYLNWRCDYTGKVLTF